MKRENWRRSRVCLKLNSTTRTRHGPDTDKVRARCRVRGKFHYTDPTGPARTQRSFAAKKVRAGPCGSGRVRIGSVSGPCRVRVVEFSYYATKSHDAATRLCRAIKSRTRATKSRDKIARVTPV